MAQTPSAGLQKIISEGLLPAAKALEEAGVQYALVGSLGAWAYDGEEPARDVDLVISPTDIEESAAALSAVGFAVELTPGDTDWEWWFFRAWNDACEFPVEIIYAPTLPSELVLDSSRSLEVEGYDYAVAAPTIILALKLAGLREQHPNGGGDFIDFAPLLRMARALGAFIDFTELRELTKESPYAKAFMELMGALEEGWGSELPEHYVDDQRARIANVRELVDSLRRRYPTLSNYEALGGEYYDARRHPACAEFRLASKALIDELLPASLEGALLETGAGDSLFAELLHERGHTLEQLIISDAYPAMLTHSQRWCDLGAMTLLAPADALPLADASIEFVVAALADPYNHPSFWREAARVLELGGQMLFTTPTYDWTMAFRAGEHAATLALGDDLHVVVPSVVLPEAEQRQMIEGVGLTVLAVTHFLRWQFRPAVASDALLGLAEDDAVISCFHCCR